MEEKKLFCVSLGCDKNLVDTEKMLRLIRDMGISFTDDQERRILSSSIPAALSAMRRRRA